MASVGMALVSTGRPRAMARSCFHVSAPLMDVNKFESLGLEVL